MFLTGLITGSIFGSILTYVTTKYYNQWKKRREDKKSQESMKAKLQYLAGITKTYKGRKRKRIILHG